MTSPPLLRVMVTRPALEAQSWAERLQSHGFAAESLSLIGIGPADGSRAGVLQAWEQLAHPSSQEAYAAVFFVSSNAVAHFFKPKVAPAQETPAQAAIKSIAIQAGLQALLDRPTLRWMAPGPGTAAALMAAGVPEAQIDAPPADAAQFDSETLWRHIGNRPWQGKKVLVVCGQSPALFPSLPSASAGSSAATQPAGTGRGWLTARWQSAGAKVDTLVVYQRLAPVLDASQLQRARLAAQDGSVWLFSSAEAIACLVRQPGLAKVSWQQARALVTHPRIANAAQAQGWGVVAMSRPALADVCQALRSIEST